MTLVQRLDELVQANTNALRFGTMAALERTQHELDVALVQAWPSLRALLLSLRAECEAYRHRYEHGDYKADIVKLREQTDAALKEAEGA